MWGAIKRLFAGEKQQASEEIKIDELELWLDNKASLLRAEAGLYIKEIRWGISQEVDILRQRMLLLEKAELINPNVPERAKHYMEGNRVAYLKKLNMLTERMKPPEDIHSFITFSKSYEKEFLGFLASSSRSYQILSEFFSDELRDINISIKKIGGFITNAGKDKNIAGLIKINSFKQDAANLKSIISRRAHLEGQVSEQEHCLLELTASLKRLNEEAAVLESDEALRELRSGLEKVSVEIKKSESAFLEIFSPLESAIKKFSRMTFQHKSLAENYLSSPLTALSSDVDLRLLDMLESIKKLIISNELELKEKKKEKILSEISALNKEHLDRFLKTYGALKKQEKALADSLNSLGSFKKLDIIKEQIDRHNSKVFSVQGDLTRLKKQLDKKDVGLLRQELASKICAALSTDIKLV